ncbi:unnamed protein product [Prorocentrum cordatum]|uniref:Uncharacterized protein n=1 Tax=Prorocentrum cordatum TaxID=2364126 RepID=A0ABN9UAD3_9DINO|nr:unnamed protein product [Polarella glacialis]
MSRRRSAGRRANLQACWPPPSEGPNERCESAAARMVVPPPALPRPAPCAQSAALARGGLQVSREIGRKGEAGVGGGGGGTRYPEVLQSPLEPTSIGGAHKGGGREAGEIPRLVVWRTPPPVWGQPNKHSPAAALRHAVREPLSLPAGPLPAVGAASGARSSTSRVSSLILVVKAGVYPSPPSTAPSIRRHSMAASASIATATRARLLQAEEELELLERAVK